jgi:hypothetical protein
VQWGNFRPKAWFGTCLLGIGDIVGREEARVSITTSSNVPEGLGKGVEGATIDVARAQGTSDMAGAIAEAEGVETGGSAVV